MLHGDVVNQLHDDDGFADAGATEQADFAAAEVGLKEVDDLDAGLEHFEVGGLVFEGWSRAVNGVKHAGIDGAHLVDRLVEDIENAAEGFHGLLAR